MAALRLSRSDKTTLIDDADLDLASRYNWSLNNKGYATGGPVGSLHRLLMYPPTGKDVDHINKDRLDNRRSNLRICTRTENNLGAKKRRDNTSQVKGVTWRKDTKRWQAQIQVQYQNMYLGCYDTLAEATQARKRAERIYGPKS